MKFQAAGKNKKIVGTVLASALIIGSLGTITAFAANNSDAVQKGALISVPAAADASDAPVAAQGTIQYSKDVYSRTDGSQNMTTERWYNPETKDNRSDTKEYSADHQLLSYQSTYYVNGGNDLIIVQRDLSGNPVNGKIIKRADNPDIFKKYDLGNLDFSALKDFYKDSSWTSVGSEQAPDGKILNKVMQSYQSYISDTTQANMQLIEFLDQDTGLPVKEELYEDSTGQFKLFSTDTSELNYVADDGSIFNTDGISLTPFQTQTAFNGK
ncbi:hypothetical protein ACFOLF_22550 [Paenibacillus sepulcri]|uniref:Uncharacterized protein n=1 Tax=Paenibacillus sepulcri TaxID=359917 RepID=A0ABS7BWW9_9BACL|nr:hypothetical protein [Paenibacillus sepulcri]